MWITSFTPALLLDYAPVSVSPSQIGRHSFRGFFRACKYAVSSGVK